MIMRGIERESYLENIWILVEKKVLLDTEN